MVERTIERPKRGFGEQDLEVEADRTGWGCVLGEGDFAGGGSREERTAGSGMGSEGMPFDSVGLGAAGCATLCPHRCLPLSAPLTQLPL